MVKEGIQAPRFTIRDGARMLIPLDFSGLTTNYAYTLMLPQCVTERLLIDRLVELGGTVVRSKVLASLAQDADGVTATFNDGDTIRARYVVGADGIHSTVREQAGIGFEGGAYDESFILADVHLAGEVPVEEVVLFWATAGLTVVAPLPDGTYRIVAPVADAPEEPSVEFVQQSSTSAASAPDGWSSRTWCGARASASTIASPTRIAPVGCCWRATRHTCTARQAGRA